MRSTLRLARVELKLLLREPTTVVFSLALPVIILFVLGGVFGDEASPPGGEVVFRGVGPTSYYVPAYVSLVVASVCVISIPTHLAGNRERGVLRRLHASAVEARAIAAAEVLVALVVSAVSAAILLTVASLTDEFDPPVSVLGVLGVFLFMVLCFSALGVLLGAVLPTARAAQAVGMLVWFVMLFLGGAGPPPEVLTDAMRIVSDLTPLWHAVRIAQRAWLGLDAGVSWVVLGGIGVVSAFLALRLFRWE